MHFKIACFSCVVLQDDLVNTPERFVAVVDGRNFFSHVSMNFSMLGGVLCEAL